MEVHTLQNTDVTWQNDDFIVKELDDRNMGQGNFNASCIIQSIHESNIDLKRPLLQTVGRSSNANKKNFKNIINATTLNPEQSSTNNNSQKSESEIQLICKDDGA